MWRNQDSQVIGRSRPNVFGRARERLKLLHHAIDLLIEPPTFRRCLKPFADSIEQLEANRLLKRDQQSSDLRLSAIQPLGSAHVPAAVGENPACLPLPTGHAADT